MEQARPKNNKLTSIRVNPERQIEYKAFFASRGLSFSKGVQIAIDHLIDQTKKGNIEVRDTGVFIR